MKKMTLWITLVVVAACFGLGFGLLPIIAADRANWLTTFSFIISVLGFAFTAYSLLRIWAEGAQQRRGSDEIEIRVTCGEDEEVLKYRPLRRDLTRGELQGILGAYGGKDRFGPEGLIPLLHSGALGKVADGRTAVLIVPLDSLEPSSREFFSIIRQHNRHPGG